MLFVYKIKRLSDGAYWAGGKWRRVGNVYGTEADAIRAVNYARAHEAKADNPSPCILVKFELVPVSYTP